MQSNKTLLYGAAVTVVLIWGTAYTLIGHIVQYITPAWVVAVRTNLAALILVVYVYMSGEKLPELRNKRWLWYGYMGFIGMALPFYFTAKGQVVVDSGLTAILAAVMPLMTIVLAHFFVPGERLSWRKALGFIIGFAGIVYLFLPSPFKWALISEWRAQSLILLTALCYALLSIIAKRAPKTPASVGAAIMLIIAAILSVFWAISTGIPDSLPPISAIINLVLLALGATAFAQILYLKLIEISGPSLIAKLVYLVPICSIIAGIIFLDEPFSWRLIIAMGIIFAGLLIARSGEMV